MASQTEWNITRFSIKTSTVNGIADSLYANGRMQVPVLVFVQVYGQREGGRYDLTQDELDSICLVDYDDLTNALSGSWTYSDQRNDFSCTLGAASEQSSSHEMRQFNGFSQVKVFWVSTSCVENKNIGASIQQPDGTVITTHRVGFDSYVTLKGREPIVYTTDNIKVTRENVENGMCNVDWSGGGIYSLEPFPWSQDNYYVSTTQHTLHKAEIYNFDATGRENLFEHDDGLSHCYAKRILGDELKLFFIWDKGPETRKLAGMVQSADIEFGDNRFKQVFQCFANIRVNQRNHALCLSRVAFKQPQAVPGTEWTYNTCGFTLYDIYGNMGTFYAKVSSDPYYATTKTNKDRVVIADANPDPDPDPDLSRPSSAAGAVVGETIVPRDSSIWNTPIS